MCRSVIFVDYEWVVCTYAWCFVDSICGFCNGPLLETAIDLTLSNRVARLFVQYTKKGK
jgi:hypothetical protein